MNIIEQLGGYEKAKRELQLKIDGSVLQCCMSVTADMIKAALLEHRRQHNFYEVGDKIVYSSLNCSKSIKTVETVTPVRKKPKTFRSGRFGRLRVTDDVRHATDAEIEAGHRL